MQTNEKNREQENSTESGTLLAVSDGNQETNIRKSSPAPKGNNLPSTLECAPSKSRSGKIIGQNKDNTISAQYETPQQQKGGPNSDSTGTKIIASTENTTDTSKTVGQATKTKWRQKYNKSRQKFNKKKAKL